MIKLFRLANRKFNSETRVHFLTDELKKDVTILVVDAIPLVKNFLNNFRCKFNY